MDSHSPRRDGRRPARYLVPLALTAVLVILLAHQSQGGQIAGRYSVKYAALLAAMTVLTVGGWVIALVDLRGFSRRLPEMSLGFPLLSGFVMFGVLEFVTGLALMSSLLAVTVTLVLLLVTAVCLPTAGRASPWSRRGAMLVAGAVIAVLVVESAFRMLLLRPVFPTTDAEFAQVIARDWPRAISVSQEPQLPRILGLADSFGTSGHLGNYHYLVETLLNKGGPRVEVVNLSAGGLEPLDELALLRRFGPRYRPNLVLHGIFAGSDFWNPAGELMAYRGNAIRTEPGLLTLRPHKLAVAKWLRKYVVAVRDVRERQETARRDQAGGRFTELQFLRVESTAMSCCRLGVNGREPWGQTIAIIDQIRRVAQEGMGARYAMVIHPDVLQVDDALRRSVLAHAREDPRDFDFELPQKSLLAYCATLHIPCLDLLPVFRTSSRSQALYHFRDIHYNADGNALAAQVLSEFLSSVMPLPSSGPR